MSKSLKVSAPGKLILSGEHAVVYGYPALATAINLRLTITASGKISCDIPIKSGMGSSAAYAVTQSALKFRKLDLDKINAEAYEIERGFHGNPSGVDNTIVTYGGFLWFRKESQTFKTFNQFTPKITLPNFFLVNSGSPVESTKEMVAKVAELYTQKRKLTDSIFTEIEIITRNFLKYLLGESNPNIGELIKENERLLEKLDVVSEKTKHIINSIKKEGGYAKVSGAGGTIDGSGMLILYHKDLSKIGSIAKKHNLDITPVKLGEEGVRIEK
jgi:Mevalonate kinase